MEPEVQLEGHSRSRDRGGGRGVGHVELASFLCCVQERVPSLCKWPQVLPCSVLLGQQLREGGGGRERPSRAHTDTVMTSLHPSPVLSSRPSAYSFQSCSPVP